MIKINFTPEFLEWVALQMRANPQGGLPGAGDTGLDARQFAVEFFHRAFVGRGAEVAKAAPALLAACEMALLGFAPHPDTVDRAAELIKLRQAAQAAGVDTGTYILNTLGAAIADAKGLRERTAQGEPATML